MTIATSIIGSTVMIHSLFLGSGLVQPRLREYDVKHGYVRLDEIVEKNQNHLPEGLLKKLVLLQFLPRMKRKIMSKFLLMNKKLLILHTI